MTCTEAIEHLDGYVDGSLPEEAAREVERHLAGCPACRKEEGVLRSLIAQAAALPREREPSRDLWPGIAERIGRRRGRRWAVWAPAALAAAAVVVLALTPARWRGAGPSRPTPAAVPAADRDALAAIQVAEADYERATVALLAALDERRGSLSPETLASVERNLAVIDQAMVEVRKALRQDPGRPELTRLLVSTHRKKVEVLRRVVKLSTPPGEQVSS